MDNFRILPFEIQEEIFSYLKFPDIMNASLVSKKWYETTAKSKVCMSQVRCINRSLDMLKVDHILNSSRLYQNMMLLVADGEIKSNTKILRNMRSIVNKFAGSLVHLTVTHDVQRTFELPKLKTLIYFGSYSHRLIAPNGLHSKAKNLKIFSAKSSVVGKSSIKGLVKTFKKMSSLKCLMIYDRRIIDMLINEDLDFELKEFFLVSNFVGSNSISDFLIKFRSSLDVVDGPFRAEDLVNFLTNFPKLKYLIIRNKLSQIWNFQATLLHIPPNETIKVLSIDPCNETFHDNFYTNFRLLMSKLVKVEMLSIEHLNPQILRIILASETLALVKYRFFYVLSATDIINMELSPIEFMHVDDGELLHEI